MRNLVSFVSLFLFLAFFVLTSAGASAQKEERRERTIDEFDELFGVAGLQRIAVRDTGTPQSVIELTVAEAE